MNITNYVDEYRQHKKTWLTNIASRLNQHEQGWEIQAVHPTLLNDLENLVRPAIFYSPKMVVQHAYSNDSTWL